MKPKILIVPENGNAKNINHYIVNLNYGNAIAEAGGLPLVAISYNCLNEYANLCDGLLLIDGPVVHRARYGEIYQATMPELCQQREIAELSLCKLMIEQNKPILGINRGMNLLNVFFGGTLNSDNNVDCIKKLAPDLVATKYSKNQTISAFKHKTLKIYGTTNYPYEIDQELIKTFIKGESL